MMLPFALVIGLPLYGYIAPSAQLFGKVYYQATTSDKVLALTFDDGPNEPYTSQTLDILKRYYVKATFFVIGKNVEFYPDGDGDQWGVFQAKGYLPNLFR